MIWRNKMKNDKSNKIERKKFFRTIGLSAVGLGLVSILPIRSFGKVKNGIKKVKVNIHPSAVKRNS